MCFANRKYFCVYLDLIAIKHRPPINNFGSKNNRFFILPVLKHCYMYWLIKLQQNCRIKLDFALVSLEVKHKVFIEDWIGWTLNRLGHIPVFQETDSDLNVFILAHIYKVQKCGSFNYIQVQVTMIWVNSLFVHRPALACSNHWQPTCGFSLAITLRRALI